MSYQQEERASNSGRHGLCFRSGSPGAVSEVRIPVRVICKDGIPGETKKEMREAGKRGGKM